MAAEDESHILRPLTAQEEIYWQLSFSDHIHITLSAHVAGATTPAQWRAALDAVQQRHPLLRASIEPPCAHGSGPTQPFLRAHTNAQIPLRVVPLASVPRWESEAERELATPFRPGAAPLARASLAHGAERSVFTLAVSHSISDGISLSYLVRDTLAAMAGQPLAAAPLELPPSAEQLLGIPPAAPAAPAPDAADTASKAGSARPTVRSLRFTQAQTARVVAAARHRGTTVHGALAAAFVGAMRRLAPRFARDPVRIISPVNTRAALGAADACGMYFASPKTAYDPMQPAGFWDMARDTRQAITEGSTREALVAATQAMQGLTRPGLTKAAAADVMENAFAMDVLLTNLGQTPYGSAFGDLRLESLWPAVLGGPAVQTVGSTTTGGCLCLLLTSREPIPALLETAQSVLLEACEA